MGQVWLVDDTTSGQAVALKVITKRLAHTERSVLEFIQEFRLMTQLRHPNCCEVADYGLLPDGVPYLTMEVVPGQGLDELLPLPTDRFVGVFSQILYALGYIHSRGFVHCDLKAANVRVRPDGVVKLMDYGLMEYAGRTDGPIKGTLAYMAPEMIKRGLIDRRSDLYSAGCLAYELLTGVVPFIHEKPGDVLRAHVGERPAAPSLVRPGVDPRHEAVVLKLLAKDPIDRFQSADEVLSALGLEDAHSGGGGLLTSPLMGRAQEMAKLFVHLARVVTGKPGGLVWLTGPVGIGKSRLLKEFGFNVQLENLPFAVGQAHEFAQTPYGPFVALLRGLLPAFKESIPDTFTRLGPVVAQLLPELGHAHAHGFAQAPALESASNEKLRLQATIAELLVSLARQRPTVLMLENWQWADPLSNETFEHVMRAASELPLLFLVSSRLSPDESINGKVVLLPAMGEVAVRRMVASILGTQEVPPAVAQTLLELGDGIPYQIEVLLEHLVTTGLLVKTDGAWAAHGDLAPARLPKGLRALLATKITTLPSGAQRLARVAAVFGRGFSIELARQVAGVSDDELFQALAQLVQPQIVVQDEVGHYHFAQDQIQELVYLGIGEADRLELHAAVARVLEAEQGFAWPSEMPLEALTAITDHYMAADVAEKTIPYALEAGLRHLDLFANGPAETYLAAGLTRLDADDSTHIAMRLNYLRGLGEVLLRTGRTDVARERCEEAIGLAQELGDDFLLGRLLATLARILQGLDELESALHYGEWAVGVSIDAGDPVGAARCLLVNARTRFFRSEEAAASADLARALELARASGDKAILGEALANMGYMFVAIDTGKLGEGMACLNEAIMLLAEVGDKQGEMTSRGMLGNAQAKLGDYAAAQQAFGQALGLAHEVGNRPEICSNQIELAINAVELGDFKAALALARAGSAAAVQVQSSYQMGTGLAVEAYAQAHLGHFGEADALMHVAAELASELSHQFMEIRVEQYRAEVFLLMGRLDAAARSSERLQRLMRETGNLEPQARLYALLGEVFGRQGDMEGAREYLEGALAIATLGLVRGTEARVLKGKAWLAMRSLDWEAAYELGSTALKLASHLQLAYMQAELEGLLGEVALATGRPEAYSHFERMGAICAAKEYTLLGAQADFGLAASRPYAPGVAALVQKAQTQLRQLAEGLDEEASSCFLGFTERQRILNGNHIAFSMPAAGQAVSKPQGPGLWKMLDQ